MALRRAGTDLVAPMASDPAACRRPAVTPCPLSRMTTKKSPIGEPGGTGGDRLGPPAVAPGCMNILLPGIGHDRLVARAVEIGLGDAAGAQAVRRRAPACCPRRRICQTPFPVRRVSIVPAAITRGNTAPEAMPEPCSQTSAPAPSRSCRRARGRSAPPPLPVLVAPGVPDTQRHPRRTAPQILMLGRHPFRPPQAAAEPDQRQGAVPQAGPSRAPDAAALATRAQRLDCRGGHSGRRPHRPLLCAQDAAQPGGDHWVGGRPQAPCPAVMIGDRRQDQAQPA